MKNSNRYLKLLMLLALMSTAPAAFGQSQQPATSSAPSSPKSITRAGKGRRVSVPPAVAGGDLTAPSATADGTDLISACSAAADELRASRELIDALENENAALNARLTTEKQTTALLGELNETRKTETEALRSALAARAEALAAKDSVIAAQDKLIETLKRKKSSPWRRIGDVLVGVGIGMVLR